MTPEQHEQQRGINTIGILLKVLSEDHPRQAEDAAFVTFVVEGLRERQGCEPLTDADRASLHRRVEQEIAIRADTKLVSG